MSIQRRRLEVFIARLNTIIGQATRASIRRGSFSLIWPFTLADDLYGLGLDLGLRQSVERHHIHHLCSVWLTARRMVTRTSMSHPRLCHRCRDGHSGLVVGTRIICTTNTDTQPARYFGCNIDFIAGIGSYDKRRGDPSLGATQRHRHYETLMLTLIGEQR